MTPQEQQLLNSLVERINQTQLQEKDSDAEALLNQGLGANPDAIYILAQTVLVQNIALDQARAQVSQLQQQLQQASQPAHATSFLGRLLGEHDPAPPPQQPPPYQPVPQYGQPQYNQPQYGQPQFQQTQYVPVGGQPSFLRGAMQTAAGVAAGALAFEGVESILHGFGGHGTGGPGMMGGGFGNPGGETVINNYYDDKPGSHQDGMQGFDTGSGEHHSHDTLGQFGDQGDTQFSGAGQDTIAGDGMTTDDQAGFDDSDINDSGANDMSAMDDGGQADGGAGFDDGGDSSGDLS